jgi:hypothetical protein
LPLFFSCSAVVRSCPILLRSFLAVDLAVVFSVVAAAWPPNLFRNHLHRRRIPRLSSQAVSKQCTAYGFRQRFHDRLWEKSFYDYILRLPDSIENVACYIWWNRQPKSWPLQIPALIFAVVFAVVLAVVVAVVLAVVAVALYTGAFLFLPFPSLFPMPPYIHLINDLATR